MPDLVTWIAVRRVAGRLRAGLAGPVVAVGAAAVAGTALVLGMSAVLDLRWDPRAAVGMALAAVWLTQSLVAMHRHLRRRRTAPGRHRRAEAARPLLAPPSGGGRHRVRKGTRS
ncbi:hypothetical protein ACGFI9_21775 [Micromonospora sp. NPDC048930]|uniref:hypothetical protein n=1 Tax=Micromonospora sp. NPDC048930 TaxID=3364261 RepID=UPI00372387EB